jgi:hypothetical protein
MISLIIFAFAPMCQALMDALVWRFGWIRIKAISRRPEFWNVNYISANHIHIKTIGGWKFDGWHCTQSAMICFLIISVVVHRYEPLPEWWAWYMQAAAYSFIWIGVKPFTYGKIAPKPKAQ